MRGKGFTFNLPFGNMFRKFFQTVVLKKNLVCREICAVTAIVGYRQAAETVQWSLAEGQGSCSRAF